MDDDDELDEQKKIIDLRGVTPVRPSDEDDGDEDLPPRPEIPPSLKVYRRTPFGEVPLEDYEAIEGLKDGVFLVGKDTGMGKVLIFAGLALLGIGVVFELMDRAEKASDKSGAPTGEPPQV